MSLRWSWSRSASRLLAGAVLAALIPISGCGREPAPPSIVVILIDALRPDHLGCYGYPRATSPRLDALATEAVRFEAAASVASWTKPSIPSLFTSLYPIQHGVYEGSAHGSGAALESDVLPGSAVTLAEALRDCGYATGAFVHNAQLRAAYGFDQGFDLYAESGGDAGEMARALLTWIREREAREERPFFAYLHLLDTHWPYEPPDAAMAALGLAAAEAGDDRALRDAVNEGLVELSPGERRRLIERYDGEIRRVDGAVGLLWDELQAMGLEEEILLLITSDHGEGFLEHGRLGHGYGPYEELLRVPLLLRPPGGTEGRSVGGRMSILDLMPTLLEAASCAGPPGYRPEGRSLAPLLAGGAAPERDAVVAEERHGRVWHQSVWRDGWKLIRTVREPATAPPPFRFGDDPEGLALVGRRFEVEGDRLDGDRFLATGIEAKPAGDDDDELIGFLETVDLEAGRATLLGYTLEIDRMRLRDADGEPLPPETLRPRRWVKVQGRAAGPRRFTADKARLLEGPRDKELEGIVQEVRPAEGSHRIALYVAGLWCLVDREDLERATGDPERGGTGGAASPPGEPRISVALYHLPGDPGERRDLAAERPGKVAELRAALEAWERDVSRRTLPRPGRSRLDPETVEKLRALGYVQ